MNSDYQQFTIPDQGEINDQSDMAYQDQYISETASDSGGPRSILKKRGGSAPNLTRSQSTPSIRDSLEVTKEHMKGHQKPETPKSAKKSVRFSEKHEPVFFCKSSSPSRKSIFRRFQ